jgi:hypothetical protein
VTEPTAPVAAADPGPISSAGGEGSPGSEPIAQRDVAGFGLSGSGSGSWERVVPTLVTTTGAVTLAMAFMLFGKRRRDGDPPADDDVLSTAAATGPGIVATASLVAGGRSVAPAPAPIDVEAGMPRWRRPSLLQARKADPLRTAEVDVRMTFDHGLVGPVAGLERRTIRYRLVPLLDRPDEVLGAEIGILDRDDEVQLLERSGAFWRVLCPDGGQGWVHRMTIGDAVATEDARPALDPAAPELGGPGGEVIEEDVLAAYILARSHAD